MAFEMGLSKTFIAISVMNDLLESDSEKPNLVVFDASGKIEAISHAKDEIKKGTDDHPLPIRGSYPLMVINFALVIADEAPLENDDDEVQTLIKWLLIRPWNDPHVFNAYFVTKKSTKSQARTLKGDRNAILSTSLRACIFPLAIDDTFDGVPVVAFARANITRITYTLPAIEATHQKTTKQIWDPATRKKYAASSISSDRLQKRRLPEILKARMKVVYYMCGDLSYGDCGASDYMGGNQDLEETLGASSCDRLIDMSAKEARKTLLNGTKKSWFEPPRIQKALEILSPLVSDQAEGKCLVYDEFLQTLDVFSNALRANKIKFLEVNDHMTQKQRDAVLRQFMIPDDPIWVLLITIQCGGLGLTLTEASNVFILTPYWNPSLDRQAIARANRIGQKRQVRVWEFCCNNSIEQYVDKAGKRKDKKAKLVLHHEGVPQALRERMMRWGEKEFRRHLTKLRLQGQPTNQIM
ncbi:hypothetical protein J1614_007030 [Plenodomus biglobosus]|nr:hypothetical protein J1614_007030 [Plenodomus biglobosus]